MYRSIPPRSALRFAVLVIALVCLQPLSTTAGEDRESRVRRDLEEIVAAGQWIYDDLPRGFAEARQTGKPLLVVVRCIPCDACRGFDAQIAALNRGVRDLLDRFVRVRIPKANGLDLSVFQFDFDLSFYAFFLHADGTIYGRFGSPSTQHDKVGRTSLSAFREALTAVLDLHARHDEVKASLAGKKGPKPRFPVPEKYPGLEGKFGPKLDYRGKVVPSCIHCHMIRDSERVMFRSESQPIPDKVLYPWPLPDVFGVELDPRRRATVKGVAAGSVGERAGFRPGDELLELEGQPLVSIADVQWVLEQAPPEGKLVARVRRDGTASDVEIPLESGWRKRSDISWRVTTWDLRRMGTGGLKLVELPDAARRRLGLPETRLALQVEHAGQYGEHGTAKRAGFRKGDIIVSLDGRTDAMRETDFIAYTVQEKRPGDRIELLVRRGDKTIPLGFKLR